MKFSITIPAFKRRFLKEAIDSVCRQTYTDWELIVVDDCSPEDLRSVVEPYLADGRVHYHRNAVNCGAVNVVDNWNICLKHCTGDYVICMGDDDCMLPCCLEEYRKLVDAYPDLNVYHAWTEIIDENNATVFIQQPRPERESALSLLWNRWNSRWYQFIGDFCYNTSHLRDNNGYYKLPLAWGSDDVTAVRAAIGNGIANTQRVCFQYRDNRQSITSSKNARIKLEATLLAYQWFRNYLDGLVPSTLSYEDRCYRASIDSVCKKYYMSIGEDCMEDVHGNPFRMMFWYKQLKCFDFPMKMFVKWYFGSFSKV